MSIKKLAANFRGDSFKSKLIRGGLGSVVLRISGFGLSLLMAVVLARTLGAEGYGIYAYVLAIVTLLAIPAQAGLPPIVVRETARAQAAERWGLMRGLWRWAGGIAIIVSSSILLLALVIVSLLSENFSSATLVAFYAGLVLMPLIALGNLRGAALRGLRFVLKGQLPESVLRPAFLILLLLLSQLLVDERLTPASAMIQHCVAAAVAFLIGGVMLWRARPEGLALKPLPEYDAQTWRRSILPLSMIAGANVINSQADIIMLGWFVSAEDVGVYRVAASSVLVIIFGKQAIASVISPHFARLYFQQDIAGVQRLVTKSTQAMLALALPIFLLFVFAGETLLEFAFGPEFSRGYTALAIMSVGYVVSVAMGAVSALLNMAGHENYTARGVAIAAVLNIIFNLILIPVWGIDGAAIAMAISVIASTAFMQYAAVTKIGIRSAIFSGFTRGLE